MKFEYPNILWFLALLAIPIIIHLFHFKRFKTLYFSSLIFVKQVEQETKSVKKLKHLLILISRILAFIALILAFAKPYIPLENNDSTNKTSAIYIDNSFSMTNLGSDGQLFEVAKAQARRIVEEMTDDQGVYIFTNDQSSEEQRRYSKKEALERIGQLTISPFSRTFSESANWIQAQSTNESTEKLDNFIYLSDFQNKTSDGDIVLSKETTIFPVQLLAAKKTNVSIDTAWFSNPNFKINTPNELHVILSNHGEQDVENIALNLKTNQTQRDIFVNIRANDTSEVLVNYTNETKGWVEGKLSILDEGIIFDDDLYFSYNVQEESKVVILNGEDAVPNIATVFELDSYYKVSEMGSRNVDNALLQEANTIVLNGLNNYPTGLVELLANKASEGAGVAVFPGKNPEWNEINSLLTKLGLGQLMHKATEKFKISTIATNDPFFKGVFKKIPQNINLPTLNSYYKSGASGNSRDLLKLENGNVVLSRSTLYNTFLFHAHLGKEEGNFTANAIFSTILLRIGEMTSTTTPLYLTIGKEQAYPVVQDQPETPIRLVNDAYEFIPYKYLRQGKSWFSVLQIPNKNIVAGHYKVLDTKEVGVVSLNYDRSESAVEYAELSNFVQDLNEKGFSNVKSSALKNNASILPINTSNKKEYWKLLLILSLVFFVTEIALIKFWK